MEKRRTRKSFTEVLRRLAKRLDSTTSFELYWNLEFINQVGHTKFQVNALWVAGSYARGSLNCGDLDLVMELVVEEGYQPPARKISRLVFGHAPDVRLYLGTPASNTSGLAFPEAKPIWSRGMADWEAALENIPLDPEARRFSRKHDILPLRQEQVCLQDLAELDNLVTLSETDVIVWEWIPAAAIGVNAGSWNDNAREMFSRARIGKKTKVVMELAIEWLQNRHMGGTWEHDYQKNCHFKACGTEVFLGLPPVPIHLLDSLSCSHLLLVPHLSRRGPNGLWFISRGNSHPVQVAAAPCTVFIEATANIPVFCFESGRWGEEVVILDLFASKEAANMKIFGYSNGEDYYSESVPISGKELLEIISFADVVTFSSIEAGILSEQVFAITQKGTRSEVYFEGEEIEIADTAELAAAILANIAQKDWGKE